MSRTPLAFPEYWVNRTILELFRAETTRLDGLMSQLCDAQTVASGVTCYGFLYQGQRFVCERHKDMRQPILPSLAHTLFHQLAAFMADWNSVENDKANIKQLLGWMLRHKQTEQEIRNSLPECVVSLVGLDHYLRTEPISFENMTPQFKNQYEKWLPKIEMYSVTCLLY